MRLTTALPVNSWHARSWCLIAAVTLFFSGFWTRLPLFLDIYYHLGVMQGFLRAGGVVLHDFWEYAPAGRPHLYPPLLHILLTIPGSLGWDPLTIARLLQWLSVPLTLAGLWWCVAHVAPPRQAFFTVVTALAPYCFFLATLNTLAASLAFLELFGWLVAIERRRPLAGALCSGLMWYTHLGLPWLASVSLALYGLWRPDLRRVILLSVIGGFLIGSPWLYHVWRQRAFLGPRRSYENHYIEMPLWFWLMAAVGLVCAVRRGGRACLAVALWLGFLPMLAQYRYRFMCAQGLLPPILLGGLGCEWACARWEAAAPRWRRLMPLALMAALWSSPLWVMQDQGPRWLAADSTVMELWPSAHRVKRTTETALYHPRLTPEVVRMIQRWSAPDDIIGADPHHAYTAGLFAVLAGRATSTAMFAEALPQEPVDVYRTAQVIVWLKHPLQNPEPALVQCVRMYGWVLQDETDLAYLFRNPLATGRVRPARPVMSLRVAGCLSLVLLGLAVWDLRQVVGRTA